MANFKAMSTHHGCDRCMGTLNCEYCVNEYLVDALDGQRHRAAYIIPPWA